ncbi:MAG TPA: haloacid dehalogenase type II [Candidatus Sulfotelmatobacter sp.]|nr:haloacid dehalogenase type II [Candidatus Sulfotelmatobacter sp.]
MDASAITALTFDVFGTVVNWRASVAREIEALGRAKGFTLDWLKFADAWRALYQPAMQRVRSGELPWTRLDDLHRVSLDKLLVDFAIKGLDEAEIDHLNRAWHRLDPWADAVEGLGRLKRRFIIAPLSNGNIRLMVDMARRAGLPWDAILGAEVAHHYKPDPEAYLTAADLLMLPPAQCMMVAAHANDLQAARKVGFRTAFVWRPLEHGPERAAATRPTHDFDIMADDFVDLARQLGC